MNKFNITLYNLKSTRKTILWFDELLINIESKVHRKRLQTVRDRYKQQEITLYEYLKKEGGKFV